jgi:hypothetical protein
MGQIVTIPLGAGAPSENRQANEIQVRAKLDSISATRIEFSGNDRSGSQPNQLFAHSQAQVRPLNQWWFAPLLAMLLCCFPLTMFGATVPELSISPTSKSFGDVLVNTAVTQTITLQSTGTAPVTISAVALSGNGYTMSYRTFPVTLSPGGEITLNVKFDPAVTGVAKGQLRVTSNSASDSRAAVDFWGKGMANTAALSGLVCSSASETGAATDACTVTLSAAAASGGLTVSLSSSNAAVTVPASVTVPANATSAGFTANVSSVSTTQTATLTAIAGGVSESFGLQLNAVLPVTVTLSPLIVTLTSAQTQAFTATVANTTNTAVTWSLSPAVGSVSAAGLYTAPASITTAQTVTVTATSVANPAISAKATVSLTPSVSVTLTPTSVSLTPSQTQAFTATVANTTNTAVTWSLSPAVGSVSAAGLYTAPASITTAQTVIVTATSVANSAISATATVQLNLGTSTLNVNATTIPFGSVTVNTTSTQQVILTSTGTAPVTVSAAMVSGTGFTDSGIAFPITLNPSQSATLNVQLDPTVAGSVTGQLTITSTSSTNGTDVIPMSATAVAATYAVNLSWEAPTGSTDPVAGYNIYRAPSGSSTYALLNSSDDTSTTFVDSTVQGGVTYDYVVDSVDSSGVESVPSNMIVVVLP